MLIVDDDLDCLTLHQTIGQKLGYYTQLAVNGLDAINMIKEDKPDLILLDIFMPQMDGFETLKNIDKYDIPVILITAGGHETIKELIELKFKNVVKYLQKPISATKLQKEISIFSQKS